jgi:hypothetical protein
MRVAEIRSRFCSFEALNGAKEWEAGGFPKGFRKDE